MLHVRIAVVVALALWILGVWFFVSPHLETEAGTDEISAVGPKPNSALWTLQGSNLDQARCVHKEGAWEVRTVRASPKPWFKAERGVPGLLKSLSGSRLSGSLLRSASLDSRRSSLKSAPAVAEHAASLSSETLAGSSATALRMSPVAEADSDDESSSTVLNKKSAGHSLGKRKANKQTEPTSARTQEQLRAGSTDDNANSIAYQEYLQSALPQCELKGFHRLNSTGMMKISVVDGENQPLPGMRVSIVDSQAQSVLWVGRTYGDGTLPFFPHLIVPGRQLPLAPRGSLTDGWVVQVEHGKKDTAGQTAVAWNPQKEGSLLTVRLQSHYSKEDLIVPVPVDVAFVVDATGSMSDEIERIQSTLLSVTAKLRSMISRPIDLRYAAVAYRDRGDEFITRMLAFTSDVTKFEVALRDLRAAAGGDEPESLNEALAVAVGQLDWREGAAKVAFLIADAPPRMDYQEDVTYAHASLAATSLGIRIHTVAASGLNSCGTLVFRQIAQLTRGKFVFIEYGPKEIATAVTMAQHGVRGQVESNNLDQILFHEIHAVVEEWGKGTGVHKVTTQTMV